jgi:hypothetical protein
MSSSDYIKKFRKFQNDLREKLAIRDDEVIMQHWLLYVEHFLCMCDECEGTHTINAPDASYYPQWPDRFDSEDEDEGGLIP